MFADGHLFTQLILIFFTFKSKKMFRKFGDFIDLDPAWIRIRIDQIGWIRIHITGFKYSKM